jgi:shikimate kinase
MTHNVGNVDRAVRTVLGLATVVGAFSVGVGSAVGIVLVMLAAVLLVTAAIGFCPLYRLLGVSTNGTGHAARSVAK